MPAGRPSKLTPEITEALCEALRTGLTYEDACLSTGIGVETFRRWRVLGESARTGKYLAFWGDVVRAMAEWKAIIHTGIMTEQGDTHFARLKLDLLSKRHPKDYSEKRVVEHQGGMALRHARLTDEELDAEIKRLAGER